MLYSKSIGISARDATPDPDSYPARWTRSRLAYSFERRPGRLSLRSGHYSFASAQVPRSLRTSVRARPSQHTACTLGSRASGTRIPREWHIAERSTRDSPQPCATHGSAISDVGGPGQSASSLLATRLRLWGFPHRGAGSGRSPGRTVKAVTDTRTTLSARFDTAPIVVEDLGLIDYHAAWELQRTIADQRAEGSGSDHLLLLEHPSVYTAGRRTEAEDLPIDGSPVVQVDRGGKITWHGPGQLVGYPIVRLAEPVDVVNYVRRLEEALIAVCTGLGLVCGRVEGRSGVWLPATGLFAERKIAAIGVRVQRGVALHGISFNCNSALDGFQAIVPCGIRDAGVTTLTRELGREVTVAEIKPLVADAIIRALDGDLPVTEHDIPRVTPGDTTPQPPSATA